MCSWHKKTGKFGGIFLPHIGNYRTYLYEDVLHRMSDALMKYETIDRDQIDDVMNGQPPRPPKEPPAAPTGDKGPGGAGDAADAEDSKDGDVGRPASEH